MGTTAEFKVILTIDSQGNAKIEEVKKALGDTGDAAKKANQDGAAAADKFREGLERVGRQADSVTNQLASVAGVTLSIAGAAYLAEKGFSTWESLISSGITAVNDYRQSIISASAMLTSMTDKKYQPDLGLAYSQWKDYFQWLWREAIEADKKVAASQREIYEVAQELAKRGVVATTQEEVEIAGRLTDLMKQVAPMTPGEGGARNIMQIRGEIRDLLDGVVRMGAQTSQIFQQIDQDFKDNIKHARETGTVYEYLNTLLQGQKYATQDMSNTWGSVEASLRSLWQQVQIRAFGSATDDVVQYGQTLMSTLIQGGELTERGKVLADALGVAWSDAKKEVKGLLDYVIDHGPETIKNVETIASAVAGIGGAAVGAVAKVSTLMKELDQASQNPFIMALLGAALGSRLGPWGAVGGAFLGGSVGANRGIKAAEDYLSRKENEGYEIPMSDQQAGFIVPKGVSGKAPPTPPTRPYISEETGSGGGGGRDTADTLENLILQLRQEQAKLTEGAFSGIDAWYVKIGEKIRKLAMDDKQLTDGMLAAKELKAAKEQKISDDLNKKYLQAIHQTTAAQEADDLKLIGQMAGHPKELQQAWDIYYAHKKDQADKQAMAETSQIKGYIDSLSSSATILTEQVALKRLSLQYETMLSQKHLEQWLIQHQISGALSDDYRLLLGMVNAAKQYNAERKHAVDLGTLEGWAIERSKQKDQFTAKAFLEGVESFLDNALTQGIQGALSKTKTDWMDVGKTMAQSIMLNLGKRALSEGITAIAKSIAPEEKPVSSGLGGILGRILGSGKPDGSQTKPFYVISAMRGPSGGLDGDLSKGIGQFDSSIGDLLSVFDEGTGMLSENAGLFGNILVDGSEGLLSTSESWDGMFEGAIGGLGGVLNSIMGLFGSGGGGGGEIFGMIASGIGTVASLFLHDGGVIAHQGILVAHSGLNLDERLIKAQVGEWVINRDATADYARRGISFDMVNSGRLPAGGSGSGFQDNKQVHFHIAKGAINITAPPQMTDREAENMVRRQILPALEKVMGNRGMSMLG